MFLAFDSSNIVIVFALLAKIKTFYMQVFKLEI